MLDLAGKFEEQLQKKFSDAFMNEHFMFYFGGGCFDKYKASDSTWNEHEFVSLKNGIYCLGYLAYSINRRTNSVYNMRVINFGPKSSIFSNDFKQFLVDIFEKFGFRKLSFGVYIGNPAEKMYDRYIRKFNGRIVGTEKEASMLVNGRFYDYKSYEIFREDYLYVKKRGRRTLL